MFALLVAAPQLRRDTHLSETIYSVIPLPVDEAVALVERVRVSAERHAKLGLDAVAMTVPGRILGVALRQCPGLPPTIAERIKDYRAQNVADWVMYRKALAAAAEARGWA